jgi:hypothetical protein
MGPNVGRPARLLLGAAFIVYLGGTGLLYAWGPWTYPMPQSTRPLFFFLIAVHVAFALGYLLGIRGAPQPSHLPLSINAIVLIAALLELVLLFPTSALNTGQWVPNPFAATRDLVAAYSDSLSIRLKQTPYVNYVRMAIAPILAVATPLAVFYWRDVRPLTRALFVASVLGTFALFVAMGANAGIGNWVIVFPWFVLAAHCSGQRRLDRRKLLAASAVLATSAVLLLLLFTATMIERTGSFAKAGYLPGIGAYVGPPPALDPATNAVVLKPVRQSPARIAFDGLAGYLTHGYFAVYLSLHEPFVPCFGVGNSVFLQRQLSRLTGRDYFLECPYPMRLKSRGWSPDGYWATIYPWIASDVTFPGAVLAVGVIGWFSGRVWLDALSGRNPWAVALLGQVLVMLYYFPAHNKIMHSGEGVIGFVTLLFGWIFTRRRFHSDTITAALHRRSNEVWRPDRYR